MGFGHDPDAVELMKKARIQELMILVKGPVFLVQISGHMKALHSQQQEGQQEQNM